jgi:Tat protein translocase TatB subunit
MNLGFSEMAFIFLLALIIFGPKKLPEIGRQIGKILAEFRRASNEFKWQLEAEMRQIEAEATRERLVKESRATDPPPNILPPANPANDEHADGELKPMPPTGETYGFERNYRSTAAEVIDVPESTPPSAKAHDA